MKSLSRSIGAFAFAALLVLSAGARAAPGEPVRLLVELPKDTTSVEAGDPGLDVQIVGVDAANARTVFGDKKVEVSATEGELVLVEGPYKYRYVPPATIDASKDVTLRAWLKQTPDVKGEAKVTLMPRRPFERLALVAPSTTLELGKSMDIEVRGVRPDGSSAAIKDLKVTTTTEGAGTLEQVSATVVRLTAPPKSDAKSIGATAHLRTHLDAYPKVAGDLSIVFTGEAPPGAPGGGVTPAPVPPVQPGKPTVPPVKDAPAEGGVLWPSGNVRILVWRTRNAKEDEWSKKEHELPASGGKLIAASRLSKLRIQIERDDVRKVELNWYIGDKKGAPVHIDDADKDGRLHLEKGKNGKTHAMLECETPEDKPAIYELLLTTSKGEILKEEFVLVRGKDKDDDGEKDKKKKPK